ncbi:DUF3817 domain-containing protein [soil metagenome]
MLKSSIGRLRAVGMMEGTSFLLLLGVAMPLKYLADQPLAVRYVGWAHGLLFVLYCFVLLSAMLEHRWGMLKGFKLFVAALLPFGPFVADRSLKTDQQAEERNVAP